MGFSTSPLYPDSGTADALKINGTPVSGLKPANGQTLVYSSSIDEYVPQTPSGGGEGGALVAHKSTHATGGSDALTPADIGAATAAQGAKADTALQSGTAISNISGLQTALDGKQPAGSYAASTHTHAISDTTGLQTALNAKASSTHTHSLSQLTQSGATNTQVPTWNGTAWVPQTPSVTDLQDIQFPDSLAKIAVTIPSLGPEVVIDRNVNSFNGKPQYTGIFFGDTSYAVFWTGTNWKAQAEYSADGYAYGESIATGNTAYPWQATGWTNGGSVTRVGTYNAALAPAPLGADAYSGVGTKAARADHVHPFPTAAQIGAASISDSIVNALIFG